MIHRSSDVTNSAILPSVDVTPLPHLLSAVRHLVKIKDGWDDVVQVQHLRTLIPSQITTVNDEAVDGQSFCNAVLPFGDSRSVRTLPADVPLDRLIGTPWRWRKVYSPNRSPAELVKYLTDKRRADRLDPDGAIVTLVGPLGLYVAHEGKNRVRFLRDKGEATMPALVSVVDYPPPDRLKLYGLRGMDGDETWCVLDDLWAKRLPFPALTLPLLAAYGVAPAVRWPAGWPDPQKHMLSRMEKLDCRVRAWPGLDLDELKRQQQKESDGEAYVFTSVMNLRHAHVRWCWWLAAVACCTGAITLALFLPPSWATHITGALAGTAAGWLLAMTCPILRVRRNDVA